MLIIGAKRCRKLSIKYIGRFVVVLSDTPVYSINFSFSVINWTVTLTACFFSSVVSVQPASDGPDSNAISDV